MLADTLNPGAEASETYRNPEPRHRWSLLGLALAYFLAAGAPEVSAQTRPELAQSAIQSTGRPEAITMPAPLASFGAAVLDGRIHLYSGHRGRVHQHDREAIWPGAASLALDDLTLWRDEVAGPAVQGSCLVATDLGLVRIGGLEARNARGEPADLHSRADCQLRPRDLGAWTELPSLPAARSSHDAAVLNHKIYVAGGWNLQGDQQLWADDLLVLDLTAIEKGWSSTKTDQRLRGQATAAYGNRIWLIGGLTEEGRTSRAVVSYEPGTGRWIDGPTLPEQGFGAAAVATDLGLFVSLASGDLLRLADDFLSWEQAGTLALPRYFHRLLDLGEGRLIALGGQSEFGRLAHAEVFQLRAGEPTKTQMVLTIPQPGRALNRQAIAIQDGKIRLIGGNTGLKQHDFAKERFSDESFVVSLANLKVEALGKSPVARQSMTLLHDEGYRSKSKKEGERIAAVLVGGFGHDGKLARSFSDCFVQTEGQESWRPIPALPLPLTQFGAFVMNQKIWLFGGLDYDPSRAKGDHFRHRAETWVFDLKNGTEWTASTAMPDARRAFASARLADRVFVVGGMGPDFSPKPEGLVFDLQSETWASVPAPATRIGADLVELQGKLYLGGGSLLDDERNAKAATTIECFDPQTQSWSVAAERLPITGAHTRLVASERRLILLSTHNQDQLMSVAILAN